MALKGIHLLSIMGNSGTFSRSLRQICTDTEVLYHVVYLMFCMLGLTTHPFFFSILVKLTEFVFPRYSAGRRRLRVCFVLFCWFFFYWFLVVWPRLSGRNVAECHPFCNSQRSFHYPNRGPSTNLSVHVFNYWVGYCSISFDFISTFPSISENVLDIYSVTSFSEMISWSKSTADQERLKWTLRRRVPSMGSTAIILNCFIKMAKIARKERAILWLCAS